MPSASAWIRTTNAVTMKAGWQPATTFIMQESDADQLLTLVGEPTT
jgi:hypothetical protein